ncbi:FAD-binding protein [Pikeienuella piscinae]|uniref:D-lactate dehydrogenase (cytochrome) n=1 Tax=Pikeienuella piscinae TaxID=2748098 RepID=A0A7M3T6M9_9RHOB|nr:FAD-linked oxidase C-terminal domain-containing protein [Pikeienuella piscinae]QIE57660.1 FAD-binding protein [Pikeienuella piscinae]
MSIDNAVRRVRDLIGERLSTSPSVLDLHGQNESYYAPTPPDAVATPHSTEEVAAIVKICGEEDCPIVAWGTGTSLEGHALAFNGGICLDLMEMNKVLEVHPEDMDAVVQPGVTRERLNEELRATGLFFPVDPGANASLGGMAATRASGTTAVRYGTMRENVLALEVVLADGRIIRTGSRARKSSSGYDLTKLMIGSEGTLGIITELTLRLQGQPESITAAVCAFPTLDAAVTTVIETIQSGVPMARIEILDPVSIRAVNISGDMTLPEKPHLFIEFHGSQAGAKEQAETFGEIAAGNGCEGFEWSANQEERNRLWHARHNFYYASLKLQPGCRALSTDVCVPISRLAEALLETAEEVREAGLTAPIIGHVGDGNFHVGFLIDPERPETLETAKRLTHSMNRRALRLGGTVTGEHGVGFGKKPYMTEEHGEGYAVMAEIKRALDPKNILNPGKVVDIN